MRINPLDSFIVVAMGNRKLKNLPLSLDSFFAVHRLWAVRKSFRIIRRFKTFFSLSLLYKSSYQRDIIELFDLFQFFTFCKDFLALVFFDSSRYMYVLYFTLFLQEVGSRKWIHRALVFACIQLLLNPMRNFLFGCLLLYKTRSGSRCAELLLG